MTPKVSVIVPVYNGEKFISRCLDSILAQTMTDYEVIIIDDGSTDATADLIDNFKRRYHQVHAFHKTNGGVSSARNLGLQKAQGDWVFFMDADDELMPNCLGSLVRLGKENQSKLVIGGYEVYNDKSQITYSIKERESLYLDRDEAIRIMYEPIFYRYLGYVWGKLFSRDIIADNHLSFEEAIHFNEDRLFVTQYICYCRFVCFTSEPFYKYYEIPSSAMSSLTSSYNEKFLTDMDGYIGMKRAIKKAGTSKENIFLADKGIADSFWTNRRMMNQFHANTATRLFKLQYKLITHLSCHSYLQFVLVPTVRNLYIRLFHRSK